VPDRSFVGEPDAVRADLADLVDRMAERLEELQEYDGAGA
jgi:hypothetical protein